MSDEMERIKSTFAGENGSPLVLSYGESPLVFRAVEQDSPVEIVRILPAYNDLPRHKKLDILEALGNWIDKELREL